jgi:hypothetical protein
MLEDHLRHTCAVRSTAYSTRAWQSLGRGVKNLGNEPRTSLYACISHIYAERREPTSGLEPLTPTHYEFACTRSSPS